MTLFALPYRPFQGDLSKNDRILDECVKHPERFTLPMSDQDIRITAASYLTNPANRVWEVWRGSEFVGILLLSRIVEGLDALWQSVGFYLGWLGLPGVCGASGWLGLPGVCGGQPVGLAMPHTLRGRVRCTPRAGGHATRGPRVCAVDA